jgi:hypothetical protein
MYHDNKMPWRTRANTILTTSVDTNVQNLQNVLIDLQPVDNNLADTLPM